MIDKTQQQQQQDVTEKLITSHHEDLNDDHNPDQQTKLVNILHYNHEAHRMEPNIYVRFVNDINRMDEKHQESRTTEEEQRQEDVEEPLPDRLEEKKEDSDLEEPPAPSVTPSDEWLNDYRLWNQFGTSQEGSLPVFNCVEELREFNAKGFELAKRLEAELEKEEETGIDPFSGATIKTKIVVEPFKPLYSNVAVGDVVCAWWHVKDMNYGLVLPIQKLPISDDLKSRFQAWKFQKHTGWLDPSTRAELNLIGHDLEEHLLWELNVTIVGDEKEATKDGDEIKR